MKIDKERAHLLIQKQALPLSQKLFITKRSIRAWYEYWDGNVCVSFSGGKDSTVLLDIVRGMYPEVKAVFVDTGLEYPEIREFVKTIENVKWIKPKMSFREVIDKHGYPVISKSHAQKISDIRNSTEHMKHIRLHGTETERLPKKWMFMVDAPFKISAKCCNELKKKPLSAFQSKFKLKPFIGMLASEGKQRERSYLRNGCNAFNSREPKSNPLSIWMEDDIWEYIGERSLPISKIYEMGYDRTGCMFCMFGLHMQKHPNRFELMEETHPKLYRYCMEKLWLRKIIDYIESQGKIW